LIEKLVAHRNKH